MPAIVYQRKQFQLMPSTSRTDFTTGYPGVQSNQNYRGVRLTIDITAIAGGNITLTISGVSPTTQADIYTLLASAAKSGTGAFELLIYPGCVAVANQVLNEVLPFQWKLTASGTASSYTMSVDCELIP